MGRYRIAVVAAAAFASGCVTINIYFPAAAAEKAADKIIDEVWRLPQTPVAPPSEAPAAPPVTKP